MGRLTSVAACVYAHSQLAGGVPGFVGKRDPELLAARDAADRVVCRHVWLAHLTADVSTLQMRMCNKEMYHTR